MKIRVYLIGYIVLCIGQLVGSYMVGPLAGSLYNPPIFLLLVPVLIALPCLLARLLWKISLLGAVFVIGVCYLVIPYLRYLRDANSSSISDFGMVSPLYFLRYYNDPANPYLNMGLLLVALVYAVLSWVRHGYVFKPIVAPAMLAVMMLLWPLFYDRPSQTRFFRAVLDNDIEVVGQMIDQGINVNTLSGLPPSLLLDIVESVEMTNILIQAGADVNPRGAAYVSVLHSAILQGREKKLRLLLEAGADISVHESSGNSPFYGDSPFYMAAKLGRFDAIQAMLGYDASGIVSRAALHKAAAKGELEAVRVLLDAGVSINSTNRWGATSLHLAVRHGHIDVVKLLLDKGVDIYITDKQGDTALDVAIAKGHDDMASSLLIQEPETNNTYGEED